MKAAVITFPGSNCDRDLAVAFEKAGFQVARVWHKDTSLPAGTDVVGLPGGFSFGDYLRCGAIAAQSPIAAAVVAHAGRGGFVSKVGPLLSQQRPKSLRPPKSCCNHQSVPIFVSPATRCLPQLP